MDDESATEHVRSSVRTAAGVRWWPRWGVAVSIILGWHCLAMPVPVGAQPTLPARMRDLLTQLPGSDRLKFLFLFGGEQSPFSGSLQIDPDMVELMARARREDVALARTHSLYSKEMIAAGLWQPGLFLSSYGTALFLAEPYDPERVPIVLVHGINGSPRDFDDLIERFDDSRYQAVCFFYPTGMALRDAAAQLETRLNEFFARHPDSGFGVIGHSMGGLVAKRMLDQRRRDGQPIDRVFVSIASPWGGVEGAQYSHRLPNHPASWDDLAPTSTFVAELEKAKFSEQVGFYVFFGARSSNRLLSTLGNNDGVVTLDSVLGSPISQQARDVFGFYEDHTSLLTAPLVYQRLAEVLDTEFEPTHTTSAKSGRQR